MLSLLQPLLRYFPIKPTNSFFISTNAVAFFYFALTILMRIVIQGKALECFHPSTDESVDSFCWARGFYVCEHESE